MKNIIINYFKIAIRYLYRLIPDKTYLSYIYYRTFHKRLNWQKPQTFNEKLQWLKLYDRNPIYTTMVDKYVAKKYVADKIGKEVIIWLQEKKYFFI